VPSPCVAIINPSSSCRALSLCTKHQIIKLPVLSPEISPCSISHQ
jgi:hypothetical protein